MQKNTNSDQNDGINETFTEYMIPVLHKVFQKIDEKISLTNSILLGQDNLKAKT